MKKTLLLTLFLLLSTLTLNAKDVLNGTKPIVDKAQHDLYLQTFQPQHQVTYTSKNFAEVNIFEDSFDGDNSVAALETRGWTVIDEDSGGSTAAWYQGQITVFSAYAGPNDTGYVAANYSGGNASGVIDQWLISPEITVTAGDLLTFYHQSPVSSWNDSINVYVSPTGGATIPDFTVEWGRYVTSQGAWALWSEAFPASGTVRFAIRYYISDNVANSNFIGIDELAVFTPAATLEPPTNLTASTGLVGMIELGWNAPAPSTNTFEQYYIYREGSLYDSSATTMYTDNTVTPETDYSYQVSAMYTEGESVLSDAAVGSALDPASVLISEDFEGGVLPANWTVVDAGSDGVTWTVYSGYNHTPGGTYSLSVSYNAAAPKDDWAFYGPMTLDQMTNYNLQFWYRIASATYPENLAVKLTSDAAGTTVATLWDQVGLTNVSYEMADVDFSPPSTGDYYIAFYSDSPADYWRIAVDDILMTASGVVPVELTSFAASVSEAGVTLNWATATETNNSGFSIERSVDNVDFNSIAFVDGMGTTTEKTSYTYVDNSISAAKAYYRLKQIDFDGTSAYSNVVEVDLTVPTDFSISQNYPNPFNPSTTIKFGLPVEAKVTINLFNTLGEKVAQLANTDFAAGNQRIDFNASNLSSGVYFYTIEAVGVDGTNFISSKKMMLMK